MKKKVLNIFIAVVTTLFIVGFDSFNNVSAETSITLDMCQKVATSRLNWYPQWAGAKIGTVTVYYDIKNKPSAYLFSVVKDGMTSGYIVTSARSDYFPIIEFGLGQVPSGNLDKCREIAAQSISTKLGSPKLLYLGGIDYLVSFPLEGSAETITVGLKSGMIYSRENLERMQKILDSRSQEQIEQSESCWQRIISEIEVPPRAPRAIEQKYLDGVEGYTWYRGGPPSAGGMLLNYYGTNTSALGSYTALYEVPGTFTWYFPETTPLFCYGPRGLVNELADYCGYPNKGGTTTDYQKKEQTDKFPAAIEYVTKKHGYNFETNVLPSGGPNQYIDDFKAEINANRPFILGLGEDKVDPELFVYTLAYGYRYSTLPYEHWIKLCISGLGVVWNSEVLLEDQTGVFAIFSTHPPIDTQPDKIEVYHRQDPKTKQLIYPEPLFKQGADVYVTVSDGTTTGPAVVVCNITATQLSHKSTITVTVRDDGNEYDMRAYDGIYTGMFNFDSLGLGNGERGIITANLNNGTMEGTFTIIAEYIPPAFINPPSVSKYIFSPVISPGTTTILFTARDDIANGTWTYTITIDSGIIPFGIGSTGTCQGSTTIAFDWNGKDIGGNILSDGTHTVTVVIGDLAENFETKTTQVIIDTTLPVIEGAVLSDYYFSPPLPKGTTTVRFTGSDNYGTWSYQLLVGTRTLYGSGTPVGTRTTKSEVVFDWNGYVKTNGSEELLGEGIHTITIFLTDFVGNTVSTSLLVNIDKTNPGISPLTLSREIFSPQGIYPDTTISFTAWDVTSPWQYAILVDGQVPGGQGSSSGTCTAGTSSLSFIWNGSPLSEGTHTVLVTITDFASNTVSATASVIIDTTKPTINNFYASDYYFAPPATVSITFTGNDDRGTWDYELKVDGQTPGGVGTPTDRCVGSQMITFIWDGSPLGEGSHTVSVNLTDLAGNTNTMSIFIVTDNTPPTIGSLTASDYYFSPGSSTGVKDTTTIYFTGNDSLSPWTYSLLIGTRTIDGAGTPQGTQTGPVAISFQWNGKVMGTFLEAGQYNVLVVLTDQAGNTKTETIAMTIDNTPPTIITELSSTSYYFSPLNNLGTPTFSFEADDDNNIWYYEWIIGRKTPQGTATGTATGMTKIEFTWNGRDNQGNRYAEGTYSVVALLTDSAGNTRSTMTQITIDDTPPEFIAPLQVIPTKYSYNSPILATITFTALDKSGGTYTIDIDIDGEEPGGIGSATGVWQGSKTVVFYWNGRDKDGSGFADGFHTVQVTLKDVLGLTTVNTTQVELESTPPTISSYDVSTYIFSPIGEKATTTTIKFTANDNTNKWSYELRLGTRTPAGWGSPTSGACEKLQAIVFTWNGRWMNNGSETLCEDGIHSFTIRVWDEMSNETSVVISITIDTVLPQIEGIEEDTVGIVKCLGERILFKLDATEEGEAVVLLGTTTLQSAEEVVTGGQFISLDGGWNQFETDPIGGWVEIIAVKLNPGTVTSWKFKIKDYTTVRGLYNAINTALTGIGTFTYSTFTDRFTLSCYQDYRIIVNQYDVEAFHVPFFTSTKIPVGYVTLPDYRGNGIYKGYFEVPKMDVASSFDLLGYFMDSAGNWASNNGTYSHSIQLDGTRPVPVGNSKIIGLRVEPSPATTIFNTNLTKMTLSMIVAEIYDQPFDIIGVDMGTSSATLNIKLKEGKNVDIGDTVIIWNDYLRDNKNIYKDHGRVWCVKLPATNSVTISYNSPYFGAVIGTDSIPSLKQSNMHIITGTFTIGGMALVDVGILQTGVKLYDDGDAEYHRDLVRNDGIYTGIYTVPPEIEVKDVSIIGHYIDPNANRVSNDGYPFNDVEKLPFYYPDHDSDFSNNIYVEIDTIRPIVTLVGVTSPFNPLKDKKAECKYRLLNSITANVSIEIKKGTSSIKDLGSQVANQGDNVFYWDGKDDEGNWVSDGVYRCYIDARDIAGNSTKETVYADIKVTTVEIKIDELVLDVSMPTPKENKTIVDHLTVKVKSSIDASPFQLQNLDFNLNRYSLFNKPYALFNISVHDSTGKLLFNIGPDISGYGSDPHLQDDDLPNYYIRPEDRIPPEGTNTILSYYPLPTPYELPEYGDHNPGNDFDTLKPFDRGVIDDKNCKNYQANFVGGLSNLELGEGTYYIRVFAKLVAGYWEWAGDWERDTGNNPIGERWHFLPDYGHYGILSTVFEQRFELRVTEYNETDHTAPVILESFPANNEIVAPGAVKSGDEDMEHVVWVRVTDNEQKVDFGKSKITLKDANGDTVDGQSSNNAVDKLYWIIDKVKFPDGLTTPGQYFIEIKAMDKAANSKWETRKFNVEDKIPPKVESTYPIDGAIFGEYDTIGIQFKAVISEKDTGASGIDWDKSKILLFKDNVDITNQLTRYEPDKVNENYGTLKYSIASLLSAGTYTMKVEAWDKSTIPNPNGGIQKVITFYVTAEGYIYVKLGALTYLSIPPMTWATCTTTGSATLVGSTTIAVGTTTDTPPTHDGLEFIEPVIRFLFEGQEGRIVFSRDVVLTMYYTEADVIKLQTLNLSEKDLSIYEADMQALPNPEWENKVTSVVDEQNNCIHLIINHGTELKDKYAIMYSTPGDIVETFYSNGIKRAELRIKPGTKLSGNKTILKGTIVMGTGIDPGKHKDEIGLDAITPMIEFRVDNTVTNLSFTQSVDFTLYYRDDDYPDEVNETELKVYGWDGTNWSPLSGTITSETSGNWILITTTFLPQIVAIMYPMVGVTPTLESFRESVCAYPNPAKDGWVKFRYNLSRNAQVSIKVYTILGDLVWKANYNDSAGGGIIHDWKCVNNSGKKIASELYIYRVTANDGTQEVSVTKKLIIIQ
ncbi:MAG: T9SS type A sorting domain-containing protein [bacterium]